MCGIVGFFMPDKGWALSAKDVLPEAIFTNQVRGRDSVGMFGINRLGAKKLDWLKMVGPADQFLNWAEPHKRFFRNADDFHFIVAHNRAATIGHKDDERAAHPHHVGAITLVHNGTLRTYPDRDKHISDSLWLATALNDHGDFVKVAEKFTGAYALVWYDNRDLSLNFVRNYERPLSFVHEMNGATWFASEPKMISWLLDRNKRGVEKIEHLPPNKWIKVYPGQDKEVVLIEVPLERSSTTTGSSVEEAGDGSAERRRARATVHGNVAVKKWDQCKVDSAPVPKLPPPPPPVPAVVKPRIAPEGSVQPDSSYLIFDNWNTLKSGDKVYFCPVRWETPAMDTKRLIAVGPLAVWTETSPGLEFIPGVEVRSRLAEQNKAEEYIKLPFHLYECRITKIALDKVREKIVIWSSTAELQDWAPIAMWEIDNKDPIDALASRFEDFSPEVEKALQKKSKGAI
jgi:hypothetical protein